MLALTHDAIRRSAPSVFASSAYPKMSPRYRFADTSEVLAMLEDRGFVPVRAQQGRCRIEGKADFTRHMIRFRREADLNADHASEVPELILSNSHDGTSAYRFEAGIFRVACTNGLVVRSAELAAISVRHSGGDDFYKRIVGATEQITEAMPSVMGTVATWKQIHLTDWQRAAFAEAAMELKPNAAINPLALLSPRREEDKPPTLWNTYNTAQESMLKGGLQGRNERGRKVRTRPIKSVEGDLKLNRALWTLASKLAEAVS